MLQSNKIKNRWGAHYRHNTIFPNDVPLPGSSPVAIVIESASELTETVSKLKYASPLNDMTDEQVAELHKLVDIFQVSTSKIHKNGEPKEAQTTIK